MSPEYILRKSLCRQPFCAGPYELRDTSLADWPTKARESWLQQAEQHIECMDCIAEYAEGQGYDQPKRSILLGNWNYFCIDVCDILEKAGYSIEWEDEWTRCDGCGKALRTSPDCYSWQPAYIQTDNDCLCIECLTTEDIDNTYQNNPHRAVHMADIDMKAHGYEEIQCGFESGWFSRQTDDPVKITAELRERGYHNLVFQVSEQSQFYIGFCVWHKPE